MKNEMKTEDENKIMVMGLHHLIKIRYGYGSTSSDKESVWDIITLCFWK